MQTWSLYFNIHAQIETFLLFPPDPSINLFTSLFFDKVLFHEDGSVKGIATNDVGIAKDGSPKVPTSSLITVVMLE